MLVLPVSTWAQRVASPNIQQDGVWLGYVDEDDDYAGHSQWPKYLTGFDANGRKRWQFPTTLTYQFGEGSHTAQSSSQIWTVVSVPGSGMCLAVDANRTLYGIRVRDGKPLWKQAHFPYNIARTDAHGLLSLMAAGTVYEDGCFGFGASVPQHGTKPETASILYLSARTGKIRPVLFGPPVQKLIVLGDKLVVGTMGNALLQEYSIPALLAPAAKSGSKVTKRRPQTLTGLAPAQPGQVPVPLWTQTVAMRMTRTPEKVADTAIKAVTSESLVIADRSGTGGLTALDTQTGETRWQREAHWQGTNAQDAWVGKGDTWEVIGTAHGKGAETVYLLKHTFSETMLNPDQTTLSNPKYLTNERFALEGVSARSGQTVWRNGEPEDGKGVGHKVANGILITHRYDASGKVFPALFADASTGTAIAENTPEDRAQLRQILARNGGSALETVTTFQTQGHSLPDWSLRWLRADTGTVETLPLPPLGGYIHADLVQPQTPTGRMVLRIDEDNDYAGHSQWPKYLVGCDMQGRKLWQFPAKIEWSKEQPDTVALTQVGVPVIVPATGVCLVDGCGLRVQDGKRLWKQTHLSLDMTGNPYYGFPPGPAPVYKEGCFGISRTGRRVTPDTVSVAYVVARTGVTRPVLFGLPVQQLRVIGDTLLVMTASNRFRAYSIPALLAATRKPSVLLKTSTKIVAPSVCFTARESDGPISQSIAAKARHMPASRLEVDLSDCLAQGVAVKDIEVTPLGDLLLLRQRSSLVVLERATGRKLWMRPFRETFDPSGKTVGGKRLSERTGWTVAASGTVENLGRVIIMQADKAAEQEDMSNFYGMRTIFSDHIEAIQASTGRVLWQTEWQEKTREGRPFWLIGMVDDLLVESPYLYNEVRQKPMRLRSAATGLLLDPANPTDRAAIQKAAAHHANKPVLITSGPSVYAVDLLAGMSAYAGLGGAFQIVEPAVFPIQHRVVRFFRGDDDMVGHSSWPNYVTGEALDGRSGWSLPRIVEHPLPPEKFSGARPQRVERMVPCREAGSVLCVGDDKWYGLDVRDGRILWTNAAPMRWTYDVVEASNGFLVAVQPYIPSSQEAKTVAASFSLTWVDGRTGKFRWLARTPFAIQLRVTGSYLFLFDASARMRVYSLSALLTPPKRK